MADNNNLSEEVSLINTFVTANQTPPSQNPGFLKTITNRIFRTSVISAPLLRNYQGGATSLNDIFDFSKGTIIQENLQDFRMMSTNRYRQYAAYEEMANDPIISTALDMYADDACQTDANGERVWVTCTEEKQDKIVEGVFDNIDLKNKVWRICRLLAEYGDVYIELIYDDNDTANVKLVESGNNNSVPTNYKEYRTIEEALNDTEKEEPIELKLAHSTGHILNDFRIVNDIQNMFDLQINGKTVAFARLIESEYDSDITGYITAKDSAEHVRYYPTDKFIHIYLDQADKRVSEKYLAHCANGNDLKFDVVRGKSMIHDLYSTWRDLQLLEYSIMLNRASKSSIFRFVQVEVGNMSKSNVDVTLRKVKNLIESKLTLNTKDNTYKPYHDPGPIENYLYIPVRNGQGAISVNTVGGDVNIKDLADLDFYQNKLFSGLKIPKEFLNYGDGNALFNSGAALTKLDARYARTVKRLQSFVLIGLKRMVDIFLNNKGLSYIVPNYEVQMVVPATVEDNDRIETFTNKIAVMNELTEALTGLAADESISLDMEEYLDYLSENIFGDAFLKNVIKLPDKEEENIEVEAGNSTGGPDFGGEGGFGGIDFGGGEEPSGGGMEELGGNDFEAPEIEPAGGGEEEFSGEWQDLG